MKQLSRYILISLILTACTNSSNTKEDSKTQNQPETEIKENPSQKLAADSDSLIKRNPVVRDLTAAQLKKLNQLLPKKTVDALVAYMDRFAAVQTDFEFARVYHDGRKLFEEIEDAIYLKYPDNGYNAMLAMKFIDKSFALRSSCEAECTEFVMNYSFLDLQKLAKYTKGTADDDFMKLKIMAEGDDGRHDPQWLNFFERTWDYGGGSLLGDSSNYNFLEASFLVIQKSELFKKDLVKLRERVIQDMCHRIYMYPKPVVMAEINRILKTKILSYPEAQRILDLRQSIELDKSDPPLQFNCSDPEQNCDWGG